MSLNFISRRWFLNVVLKRGEKERDTFEALIWLRRDVCGGCSKVRQKHSHLCFLALTLKQTEVPKRKEEEEEEEEGQVDRTEEAP